MLPLVPVMIWKIL
uniref:Uncharacterized protein n=1 Tax=Rhizophora mucronata TaxID=61149 RepID=A0A2P2PZQ4_RHIMU